MTSQHSCAKRCPAGGTRLLGTDEPVYTARNKPLTVGGCIAFAMLVPLSENLVGTGGIEPPAQKKNTIWLLLSLGLH